MQKNSLQKKYSHRRQDLAKHNRHEMSYFFENGSGIYFLKEKRTVDQKKNRINVLINIQFPKTL